MNTEMRISKQSTLSLVLTIGCMNKYFITSFGTIVYTVLMSFVHSQNLLFPCGFGQDAFNHTWKVTHGQKDTNLEMIRNNRKTKDNLILLHLINLQSMKYIYTPITEYYSQKYFHEITNIFPSLIVRCEYYLCHFESFEQSDDNIGV